MEIIVAKNIGFCTGVKRAVEIAKKSLEKGQKPIYFLGELIHNEKITNEIKERGGMFISNPRKAKFGTLVIRAHGTPPLPPLKRVFIEDATCPLVKRAQGAAHDLFKKGYKIIIIGEKKHPEIIGIQGHIKNRGNVIKNISEARRLKKFPKLGVIAQTTQNLEKVNKILKILKKKTKELRFINTICPQVLSRQKELGQLLQRANGILVIGSPTSANTNQLVKIVKNAKKPVWLVNSVEELKKRGDFRGISRLGVISGTSSPDWVIEKIKKYLIKL